MVLTLAGSASASDAPLSAIDWLSRSIDAEKIVPAVPSIQVSPLEPAPQAVGTVSPEKDGRSADLWSASKSEDLVSLLSAMPAEMPLPMRRILATIVSVEATTAGGESEFLLARIDALLALGQLNEARKLIAAADSDAPSLFRREFDIALLTGRENEGCRRLEHQPDMSPTYPARIFCLARRGDWPAAALTLGSARALDAMDPGEAEILGRFLDDGEADLLPPPRRPKVVTPLVFRIYEAIGEPLPTRSLPLAFAHADLRPQNGWKTRIEAAERLYRAGAIEKERLLGIYLEREPSASGGVWDRVAATQSWRRAHGRDRAVARAAAARLLVPAGLGDLVDERLLTPRAAPIDPDARPDEDLAAMIDEGRRGEAALNGILRATAAWEGDVDDLSRALAAIEASGIEFGLFDGAPLWALNR